MTLLLIFAVTTVLLIAPLYIIYKPPGILIQYFQHRWNDVLWHVQTTKRVVALTIDDAPSQHTKEIMEVLRASDATATFFVIGSQVAGREEVLTRLVHDGNELGNHAMHDEPSRSLSNAELLEQIETVQGRIADAYSAANVSQPEPRYFRPGSGFFSTRIREMIAGIGYHIALGSIYPHDPQIPYFKLNARHVLSMVRPGGIIICHDRRPWTAPMLKVVLPELRRRGYRIVGLTELLQAANA